MAAARAMRSGMTAINCGDRVRDRALRCRSAGTATPVSGRIHGPDGLREFTRAKAITRVRVRSRPQPDHAPPHRQGPEEAAVDRHPVARQALPLRPGSAGE